MSKITNIYDAIITEIQTDLPTYKRLPNPYVVDSNTYLQLQNGFGLAIGPGNDTQRYVGCLVTWERVFTIILVKQVTSTQNNLGSRELIEKSLLDDHDTLRKAFYLNSTLGGEAIKSTVLDDGGIQFLDAERLKFLSLEMNLYVEYQEPP